MSDALAAWKAAALADVDLPSGTKATIRLPDLVDCLVSGDVPLSILNRMEQVREERTATPEAEPTLSLDELGQWRRLRLEAARMAVVKVGGKPVSLTEDDVRSIPSEDRDQLEKWAMREEVLPGKAE